MLKTIVSAVIGLLFGATSAFAQCTVPNTLTNGTNADATQVMANFNALLTCINTAPPPPTSTSSAGFVNKLRNGTFVSWPSGISGTTATSPTGSAAITANGWAVLPTGASVTWAQVTSGRNGAPQSLKVTGAASVTDVVIGQRIESTDAAALAAQTITFQMAIYNNTGASITPTLATRYAGTPDVWSSPGNDLTATNLQACANATWCTEAYVFAASASAANGYEIKIDFGNNFSTTGKYVQVSAADLRATPGATTGLTSTPPAPELPNVQAELARNARYFQTSYDNGIAPGSNVSSNPGGMWVTTVTNGSTTNSPATVPFPTPMRTAPTFAFWDRVGNASKFSSYANASAAWTDNQSGMAVLAASSRGALIMQSTNAFQGANFSAYADFW